MTMHGAFNDRGTLTQLLMRRLNITGTAPVPVLMPELGANLVLEVDRPEWRALKDEVYFGYAIDQGAIVGELGGLHISIPTDLIVVITSIRCSQATHVGMGLTPNWTLPVTTGNPGLRDNRLPTSGPITISTGTATAANIPQPRRFENVAAGGICTEPIVMVGSRPQTLLLRTVATNTAVTWSVQGYYRRAQPGELV